MVITISWLIVCYFEARLDMSWETGTERQIFAAIHVKISPKYAYFHYLSD